jgi:hypothetical protein
MRMDGFGRGPGLTGATMTPEKVCSICHGTIVGFGNIAEPINSGRCCDRRYWEKVVPERVRRMLERDAKPEGFFSRR